MNNAIWNFIKRKRSIKDWCAISVLTCAVAIEIADAAFGFRELSTGPELAASNVVDLADVMIGVAAAWVMHA